MPCMRTKQQRESVSFPLGASQALRALAMDALARALPNGGVAEMGAARPKRCAWPRSR